MALGSLWFAPRRGFFYRSGHDTLLWPEFRIPILLLGKPCPAIPYSKSVLAFRQTRVVSALIALASCVENASDCSHRILGRWGRVGKGAPGDYSHDLHREFTSFANPCTAVPKLQANLPTGSKDSVRRKEIILAQLGDSDALLPERFVPSGWQLGIGYLAHTSFASFTFLILQVFLGLCARSTFTRFWMMRSRFANACFERSN
jgi:hypothetical protein